jgi:hypothetical protein
MDQSYQTNLHETLTDPEPAADKVFLELIRSLKALKPMEHIIFHQFTHYQRDEKLAIRIRNFHRVSYFIQCQRSCTPFPQASEGNGSAASFCKIDLLQFRYEGDIVEQEKVAICAISMSSQLQEEFRTILL